MKCYEWIGRQYTNQEMNKWEKRSQKKEYRRTPGAPKGHQDPIVLDAFEFWGKDISREREKIILDELNKIC